VDLTGEFREAPQRDDRPASILSRHQSYHQRITDLEGKDLGIDYTDYMKEKCKRKSPAAATNRQTVGIGSDWKLG
jgi:hypothetical protein